MKMEKISDIPANGAIYSDGSFIHYIEHMHVLKNGSCDVFGLVYMTMTIEQSNNFLYENIEDIRKLVRKDYLFRTQPYTIQEIGKTTKENFEETKTEYVDKLCSSLYRNTVELNVITAKVLFSGWQAGKFFWNAEMRDFFNQKKHLFGDVA